MDDERFISKRLNVKGTLVERVYELDDKDQIAGQWILVTKADGSKTWNKISEVIRGELPEKT